MDALSVKWPWSGLIAMGLKPFEIRTWRTKKRGPLLICSSGAPSRSVDARRIEIEGSPELGVALCIVNLVDCRPFAEVDEDGAWCRPRCCPIEHMRGMHEWLSHKGKERCRACGAVREYVWEMRDPRPVEPVQIKGQLNFFDVGDWLVRPSRSTMLRSVRRLP
jgi:hypothetical protein